MTIANITAPTVAPGPLIDTELNVPLATLTNAINALINQVNVLAVGVEPDLGGYATTAALNGHVSSANPHDGFWHSAVGGLTGVSPLVQFYAGTTAANASVVNLATVYAHTVWALVSARGSSHVWISSQNLSTINIASTAAIADWTLFVIGW